MEKQITFNGIVRNTPSINAKDGDCQEVINLRIKDNAWKPVTPKASTGKRASGYNYIYYHPVLDDDRAIGYKSSSNEVYYFIKMNVGELDPEVYTTLISFEEGEELVRITHLNNVLIIVTNYNGYFFLFDSTASMENAYKRLDTDIIPDFTAYDSSAAPYDTEQIQSRLGDEAYEESYDKLTALITDKIADNELEGHVFFRLAYKTYSGDYLMFSAPIYHEIGAIDSFTSSRKLKYKHVEDGSGVYNRFENLYLAVTSYQLYISNTIQSRLENFEGVIKSLCIFMTDKVSHYAVSDEDDYSIWDSAGSGYYWAPTNVEGIKSLVKAQSYYKIDEIQLTDLLDDNTISDELDLSEIGDIEVNESLPINDDPHTLFAQHYYRYNSYLHLGNVQTKLFHGYAPFNYISTVESALRQKYSGGYQFYTDVYLSTENEGVKIINQRFYPWIINSLSNIAYIPPFLCYPDLRAKRMVIYAYDSSIDKKIKIMDVTLKTHPYLNLSYYADENLESTSVDIDDMGVDYYTATPSSDLLLSDSNRVQVSALSNPLIYPSERSYQIGEDNNYEVLGFATAMEPMSEDKFGEYPLYVFTSKGVYSMQLGTIDSDVLYSNIININREVITSEDAIVERNGFVIYATNEGIRTLEGRKIVEISLPVEGEINNGLINSDYDNLFDSDLALYDYLSSDDFLTYLQDEDTFMVYDHVEKELLVTSENYDYSYVYSFTYKFWFKITESFSMSILNFPDVLLYTTARGEYYLSQEDSSDYMDVMIQTRPFSLGNKMLKRIDKVLLNANLSIDTDNDCGIYLFGSTDGVNWKAIQYKQLTDNTQYDPGLKKTLFSCRYFTFVFVGKIKDSEINDLSITYRQRFKNK